MSNYINIRKVSFWGKCAFVSKSKLLLQIKFACF